MDTRNIIRSLNLTEGDVLTLEKAADRMEFEALPLLEMSDKEVCNDCDCKSRFCPCKGTDCSFNIAPCSCKGPVGYIDCRPYK